MDIECCSTCEEELEPCEYDENNKYQYCQECIDLWGDESVTVWEKAYDG